MYNPDKIIDPEIIINKFNGVDKKCVKIDIYNDEYKICETSSIGDNFWANSKSGVYGSGIGRTSDDPFKPVRTGLLGQMAYSKLFGDSVDLIYRHGGDKYDNLLGKYKVDIKCAMKNYNKGLVYYKSERGKFIPINKDIYVFGFVNNEDRNLKKCTIILVGYCTSKHLKNCNIVKGYKGNHYNYEVPFCKLRCILELINYKNI